MRSVELHVGPSFLPPGQDDAAGPDAPDRQRNLEAAHPALPNDAAAPLQRNGAQPQGGGVRQVIVHGIVHYRSERLFVHRSLPF
jgi:hypothetical protein